MGRKHYKEAIGNVRQLQHLGFGARCPIDEVGGDTIAFGNAGHGRYITQNQDLFTAAGRGGTVYGLKPLYVGWQMNASFIVESSCDFTIKAGIISRNTTALSHPASLTGLINQPVAWGGQIEHTIQLGGDQSSHAVADTGVAYEAGQQFLIRTTAEVVPASANNPRKLLQSIQNFRNVTHTRGIVHGDPATPTDTTARANITSKGGGFVHGISSFVTTGLSNATSVNFNTYLLPALIVGYSERPQVSILVIGDSNAYGQGDANPGDGQGAFGYIERGLRTTASGVTACALWVRSGATLAHYENITTNQPNQLFSAAHLFTHLLQQISGNSVSLGLSEMKRLTILGWKQAKARGLKVIQLSSLPRTTSSANTTVATGWEVGGVRDQYNAWCASVVGQKINAAGDIVSNGTVYLDVYWDILSIVQNPATNLWLDSSYTTDGTHMSATAHALAGAGIATLANNLTIY